MASSQSVYSLPVLSRSEIIGILSEYQIIDVSENDLANPSPNFVFNLYSSLLLHLDSFQEDPSQVDFAALERFENPDMHVDAIRAINLCRKIRAVLVAIECPINFALPDLIRPDSNRTVKFLSAIINFFLHKDSKLSMLRPYAEELGVLEDERKQREAKILQLREEIVALNDAREREKPLVLEAEAKVKELQQTLDNLNSLQSNLRKERQAMKEKAQEMTNNVSNSEYELIQASEENAILRSKIVQSPEKLQRALEEKKVIQMEAKDSERLVLQSFQEKSTTLEVYTKTSQKMTKHLAQMQAIQEQVNSAKSVEKDVKQLKSKLSDEQMLEKSLEAKEVELQAKAEHSDEQKHLLEKEANARHEEDTRGLNNVKLEAEQCTHDVETTGRKIEAVVAEVDAIKAKIKSIMDLAAAMQEELLNKGEEIVNELNLYTRSTAQTISSIEVLQYVEAEN
ncbi:Kinetochore protein NUF2-like protein [Bienertia sinuspersici]